MKKILYILLPVILIPVFMIACSDKPANTSRIIETLGHEALHCFFGPWHDPNGKHPSRIDLAGQLSESITVTLKFATEAELQRLYREAAGLHTAPDRNIDKVDGFNLRSDSACIIYVLET